MELAVVETLHAQQYRALGNLHIFISTMRELKAWLVEYVEDGSSVFYRRLAALMSDLAVPPRKGVSVALNESTTRLRKSIAAFDTDLVSP